MGQENSGEFQPDWKNNFALRVIINNLKE